MSAGEASILCYSRPQGGLGSESEIETALQTSEHLLDIDAVSFFTDNFYQLTSGKKSPVYVDCRKIISYPNIVRFITESACARLQDREFDAIAGGETAGIPFAAWIAARLEKPMLYVRKEPKAGGLKSQIEGVMPKIADRKPRVLLVEDHATDGASKIKFVEALRRAGAETDTAFVVFYYNVFKKADKELKDRGISIVNLTTWRETLKIAEDRGLVSDETLREVKAFLRDPVGWQASHP